MKSIGSLLAPTPALVTPPGTTVEPREERLHRVQLCVQVFAEIELTAASPEEALWLAQKRANEAKRRFRTDPVAIRTSIRKLVDWRDPSRGFKWVRLERSVHPNSGAVVWIEGEDDHP